MTGSRTMRWITGVFEIGLGIPIMGGLFIISMLYIPLAVMFVLHIVTLVMSAQNDEPKYGSIMGIITSLVGWIPFVGMTLHLITGILLLVSAAKPTNVSGHPPSRPSA